MPTIKNFEKKPAATQPSENHAHGDHAQPSAEPKAPRRRPGREHDDVDVKVVHVEQEVLGASSNVSKPKREKKMQNESISESEASAKASSQTHKVEASKIEIHFPGSELLRSRFPKPFDVAENVVTDWLNDGNFENIPLQQPLARTVAQQGLLKAKQLEKKVMASPTTEKIAAQAFTFAMKAQGFLNELRSRVNRK